MIPGRPAIFLDRDGTIIRDVGYPRLADLVDLLPGVTEALGELSSHGFALVLVSNQSGIGRGLITPAEAQQVHERMTELLDQAGIRLDGAYYCPHAPDEGCPCRKPAAGLLLKAAAELGLDLARSWLIGDKASDEEAGRRAGCHTLILRTSDPAHGDSTAGERARTWREVVSRITAS